MCGLIKFEFLSNALWWPMSVKPCLIISTLCFYLFIYLTFCSVLYSINYLSFFFQFFLQEKPN